MRALVENVVRGWGADVGEAEVARSGGGGDEMRVSWVGGTDGVDVGRMKEGVEVRRRSKTLGTRVHTRAKSFKL